MASYKQMKPKMLIEKEIANFIEIEKYLYSPNNSLSHVTTKQPNCAGLNKLLYYIHNILNQLALSKINRGYRWLWLELTKVKITFENDATLGLNACKDFLYHLNSKLQRVRGASMKFPCFMALKQSVFSNF